jgi:hypothetical protein
MREAAIVDLREPNERLGDPEWIKKIPNVPANNGRALQTGIPIGH